MFYSLFEIALSKPRLGKYLVAVQGNHEKAMYLYKLNMQLSQALFGILHIFEVTLRNSIDLYYCSYFNNKDWLRDGCGEDGMFSQPGLTRSGYDAKAKILKIQSKLGESYSHDKLLTELSMGFWVYLFAPLEFKAGGQGLHKIYKMRPKATPQKVLFHELHDIKRLRNRIAHHEPICFNRHLQPSIARTKMVYHLIIKHLTWLGYDPSILLMDIDIPDPIFTSINEMNSTLCS